MQTKDPESSIQDIIGFTLYLSRYYSAWKLLWHLIHPIWSPTCSGMLKESLRVYLPTFPTSNAWDFRIHITRISEKFPTTSKHYRRYSDDFRTLPKIPEDVPIFSDGCQMLQCKSKSRHDFVRLLVRSQFDISAVYWTVLGENWKQVSWQV